MIKQIQLRGISRTPSDRMVEDGGVSESLNMYLDSAESAPILMPNDVTSKLGLPQTFQADRVFIHKTVYGDHIIAIDQFDNVKFNGNILLSNVGEIKDITSLGNTLIIASSENLFYMLYRHSSRSYSFLGNTIPLPVVEITANHEHQISGTLNVVKQYTTRQPSQELKFGNEWNNPDNSYNKIVTSLLNYRFSEIAKFSDSYYNAIVVRYGVKLYDNSYITSVPFLLSPESISGFTNIKAEYNWNEGYDSNDNLQNEERVDVTYTTRAYQPYCQLLGFNKEDIVSWKDIIQSIDIFFSTQIPRKLESIRVRNTYSEYDYASTYIAFPKEYDEEQIINKSDFRLVASYALDKDKDIDSLLAGVTFKPISDTDLINNHVALDPLKEKMESFNIVPGKLMAFNKRLLASNVFKRVTSGSKTFMSASGREHNDRQWHLRYFISEPTGDCEVLARGVDGNIYLSAENPYGWICYPNPNCYKVTIGVGSLFLEIEMKQHPWLNCAYAYLGQEPLETYLMDSPQDADNIISDPEELIIDERNKLYTSSFENPFTFPTSGVHTFDNKVIGVAVASTPLSQGQFGQFPLYVFTEDGIWAMKSKEDGSLGDSQPAPREVCTNPDSITPLDDAVVFVTKKGVVYLKGSEVVELSPNMNGRHYTPNDTATSLIGNQRDYAELVDAIKDKDSFVSFVQDAKIAYDYTGQRLIFISPSNKGFQYLYKLDTQTWHKVSLNKDFISPINSYPECLVLGQSDVLYEVLKVVSPYKGDQRDQAIALLKREFPNLSEDLLNAFLDGNSELDITNHTNAFYDELYDYYGIESTVYETHPNIIYDCSTVLTPDSTQDTAKGIIITRPFDLGEPDVYKTIKTVKIRGDFDKGNVKYFIQGSDDGRTFYNLTSLRGKSWKMFRLFILADLEPTERISWVDIEYDTRFKNRLR